MQNARPEQERRLTGTPISEGVALGRVCVLERVRRQVVPLRTIANAEIPNEYARLEEAISTAARQLDEVVTVVTKRIGPAQANIFVAQRMMILDEVLGQQMRDTISSRQVNAETAVSSALDGYEAILLEVDSE